MNQLPLAILSLVFPVTGSRPLNSVLLDAASTLLAHSIAHDTAETYVAVMPDGRLGLFVTAPEDVARLDLSRFDKEPPQ